MYNYDYETTYKINEEQDIETYQKDFLNVMNLKSYDNNKINTVFDHIYSEIKDDKIFSNIFKKDYFYSFLGKDERNVIPILFSFNSFKYTHVCLKEFLKTKKVCKENINNLENSLEYLLKK
jgi:hypothetical protein